MTLALSALARPGTAIDATWIRVVAATVALVAPLLFVLQPLAPSWIAGIAIYGRLLAGPLFVALFLPRIQVWGGLLLLCALILATGHEAIANRLNEFSVLACSLVGAVIMFRFGAWLGPRPDSAQIWRSLVIGVTVANVVSLAIYVALLAGYLDPVAFLESIYKDDPREQGLARFSLGNAIETPFMLTALLYASVVLSRRPKGFAVPAMLNLSAAIVSQSRIVILMALLVALRELARSTLATRAAVLATAGAIVGASWEHVNAVAESILLRLSGEDFGSTDDRAFLFGHVVSALEPSHLLFGEGLTSAAALLERSIGEYRTVEAIVLQLPYEIGLIGITLVLICSLGSTFRHRVRLNSVTPVGVLAWVQFLVFLPVTTMSPILGFALGAISMGIQSVARKAASATQQTAAAPPHT